MGVDLFAGTLTRFYSYEWASPATRKFGMEVERLFPGGPPEYSTWPADKRRAAIEAWKLEINAHIRKSGDPIAKWEERAEAPDFAEQVRRDGLGTLRLAAMLDERRGAAVPEKPSESPEEHPDSARWRAGAADSRYLHLAIPDLWLPGNFNSVFGWSNPFGGDSWIGCTGRLLNALRTLKQRHDSRFKAAPETEFLSVASDMQDRWLRIASAAVEHNLPVVLSW